MGLIISALALHNFKATLLILPGNNFCTVEIFRHPAFPKKLPIIQEKSSDYSHEDEIGYFFLLPSLVFSRRMVLSLKHSSDKDVALGNIAVKICVPVGLFV